METTNPGAGSAWAEAIAAVANALSKIGIGKRQQRSQWGNTIDPRDYQQQNNIAQFVLVGGIIVVIAVIYAILKKQ